MNRTVSSALSALATLTLLGAAHAAPVPSKAQQLALFRVTALANATVTPATLAATGSAEMVAIPADYLYNRDVNVKAYDLDAFLRARIPNVDELAQQGAQVMFWCIDGYAPMAKLSDVLGAGGLIAVADADAPEGVTWPDAPYKNTVLKADAIGNYVVWRDAKYPAKPQPWGLATIYVLPADAAIRK
ncbi:hypothetical protein [Deinococcus maricopensis]|uniref:Rhodanese domain-containing protein n=1 Tax=Deinococcus maricopensis (strain DSM 21211 / LMG 22137 / NRRL B-23946 / LB-34) TaxID=709986 RepID=E8U5W3_DEIML|nr:hypothetical protein [Deinococcus maricopensis]ADV66452.1 hypothetical protein Deima_0797 [Deinococcus maricopensis DSM 21211]